MSTAVPEPSPGGLDRYRVLAARVVERVGGVPAVRSLLAVLDVYDVAGGGLVANGLAYSALFALVPGLLLVLSVVGLLVHDQATRDQIVAAIGGAFPPLEAIARAAFEQVAAGAVPTSIVALVGLLWGSSRFYAALDNAFARVFHSAPRRNEFQRGVRGVLVSVLFVAAPLVLVLAGAGVTWLLDLAPDDLVVQGTIRGLLQLGSPIGTLVLFVVGTMLVYRLVPSASVPLRALRVPAILAGTALAIFTQLFTFVAPRMLGWAALFGALISVFVVLVWLSISLNVLLIGASWTRVRSLAADDEARTKAAGELSEAAEAKSGVVPGA